MLNSSPRNLGKEERKNEVNAEKEEEIVRTEVREGKPEAALKERSVKIEKREVEREEEDATTGNDV